ncbi:MAG: class I SAM-dependent methyltransferase [Candidatus Magasanikbacteria bacterium]|nr:class I SAM-dependent methyltransferase [Candidatus Magasanikbacteria bacterium]
MNKNQLKTINTYNKTVDAYIKNTDHLVQTTEMDYFVSQLEPGAKILDLGCGPGRDAKLFVAQGFSVVGVDLSKNMISTAKKRCPRAQFKIMDMADLKFKPKQFDGIWANASLLNIPKKDAIKALQGVYSVLKPGGIFYLSIKKGSGEGIELDSRYGLEKFYAYYHKNELLGILKKIGFKIHTSHIQRETTSYVTRQFVIVFAKK